jgi:5-methyltetrahydropteroyltriglutamate--homocysteine methyltransferase
VKRSTDRILTTHVGSLPRPPALLKLLHAKEAGEPYDERTLAASVRSAVAESVRQQVEHGLDVVSDGEMGKPSFITYVVERLTGFTPAKSSPTKSPFSGSREFQSFPEFYERQTFGTARFVRRECTGPVAYRGTAQLGTDLANLKSALDGVEAQEAFVPAVSPSNVEYFHPNHYYPNVDAYVEAIADAMHVEYKAIADAGFLVQIDDPRLVSYYAMKPELSVAECRKWAERRVEILNHALRDIPRDRIRFHTCYSIDIGPRIHDMQLRDVLDIILKIKAGAYSFEAANPRHDHEWRDWRNVKLPDGTILIPGVITQSTVLVEHPELVADRIVRFAEVVGRENVIAGADCGFAAFAGMDDIHPSIVWAKFKSLAEGARLASKRLWGGARSAA